MGAMRIYGACVSHLDDGVGRIVRALERTGQRDNTLVIFISDNGASPGTESNDTRYAGYDGRAFIEGLAPQNSMTIALFARRMPRRIFLRAAI